MPLPLTQGQSIVLIRQGAFERSGITRQAIDDRYNLTADEFRVEDGLVAIGPLPSEETLPTLLEDLERSGLTYFDDFFELSGNWPEWLLLFARAPRRDS